MRPLTAGSIASLLSVGILLSACGTRGDSSPSMPLPAPDPSLSFGAIAPSPIPSPATMLTSTQPTDISMPWTIVRVNVGSPATLSVSYIGGDGYCTKARGFTITPVPGGIELTAVSGTTPGAGTCPASLQQGYAVVPLPAGITSPAQVMHAAVDGSWQKFTPPRQG